MVVTRLFPYSPHFSGEVSPNSDDIEVTAKLKKAGKLLGIEVLDYMIVVKG